MNYYPFHLGDYAAHTKHLSLLEDLAYRRMIDLYYTAEKPLPSDPENVARLIGMREHSTIVTEVLSDFFLKSEEGYRSKRCDREIKKYKAKADRARSANNKRWKSETHLKSDMKSESFQIPTNNQKPITKINVKGKKPTPIPDDFSITPELESWADRKSITNIEDHLEYFIQQCKSQGYLRASWHSAFQIAVTKDWANIGHGKERRFVPA